MAMKERNNDNAVYDWKPNASAPLWDEESENEPKGPFFTDLDICLLYTSPSPRDKRQSRMPSSA